MEQLLIASEEMSYQGEAIHQLRVDLTALPLTRMTGGLDITGGSKLFKVTHIESSSAAVIAQERLFSPSERDLAAVHLAGGLLNDAHLEGAILDRAHLESTVMESAHLEEAQLIEAHLEWAVLAEANLEGACLSGAHMEGAALSRASLRKADFGPVRYILPPSKPGWSVKIGDVQELGWAEVGNVQEPDRAEVDDVQEEEHEYEEYRVSGAFLEGVNFNAAHLEEANLYNAFLAGADFTEAHLESTDLTKAHLEDQEDAEERVRVSYYFRYGSGGHSVIRLSDISRPTNLHRVFFSMTTLLYGAIFGHGDKSAKLSDIHWGDVNISVINWGAIRILGDEYEARKLEDVDGQHKVALDRVAEFEAAVRANRQLSVTLRAQGMNEVAARFTYRAQLCQRKLLRLQGRRNYLSYLSSLLLDLVSGYGYKPWRSFVTYLLVILGFATAYYLIGQTIGPSLSPIGAWVFSMTYDLISWSRIFPWSYWT